ncbi:hypothetical protein PybrP1_007328 [[Pythium] brassicae (nom. inval.)]|nr:hypothetical protein PybrP1_007328 [[Pythium] brassicae (nom. inval.)]
MWTVLFGDHDADAHTPPSHALGPLDDELDENQPPSAAPPSAKMRLSTASTAATLSPPQSPTARFSSESAARVSESSSLAPSPPPSSQGVRRASSARRGSRHTGEDDDDAQQTPMAMLLRRMNQLMMKVGEHEFEKKTLVDGMEKDRERLTRQITALERELEDLKDQNVQLQYKLEYTTEPMLLEQLQDVTDMRDALSSVKVQLETEIGEKDAALAALRATVDAAAAAQQRELQQLRAQFNHELHELECERDELEQRAADATQHAEAEASAAFATQLAAKEAALQETRQAVEALRQQLDGALSANESALGELRADLTRRHEAALGEQRARVGELEQQMADADAEAAALRRTVEDFKEDCAQLWHVNEDLKQQIALASAETMLRDAEQRETALSGQSALLDKVGELEEQLQALQEQLAEKSQAVRALEAKARVAVPPPPPVDSHVWKSDAIRVLTEQVAAAQRELSDAMDLNRRLNHRNAWLEEQLSASAAASAESASRSARAWGERVGELEAQLAVQQRTVESAEARIGELQAQLSQHEFANADLASANQRAQQQLYELARERDALSHETSSLRGSNELMAREIERLSAGARDASTQQATLEQEAAALASELESARSSALADASRLAESLRRAEHELRVSTEAQSGLDTEKRALQQELETLKAAYAEAADTAEQFRATESELETQRAAHEKAVSELKAALSLEVERLRQQLATAEASASEARAQSAAQTAELASLGHQLTNLQEFSRDATFEAETKYEEAALDLEALRRELDAKTGECEELQLAAARAAESATSAQGELESAWREVADLSAQLQQLRSVEQELTARLRQATQANEQLASELSVATAARHAVEQELLALRSSVVQHERDAERRIQDAAHRSREELSGVLTTERARAAHLEQQLAGAGAELGALRAELETAREEAELKADATQSLADNLKASRAELTRVAQAKDAELASLQQHAHGEAQRLQALAARVEDELAQCRQELSQCRQELGRAQQQAQLERSARDAEARELQAANRELEVALDKSKQFCEDLSARCEESTAQVQEYARQIQEDSQTEIFRLAHANEALQLEIERFVQSRYREASAEEELHLHIAELQAENNVLAARAHRLTQQLSQFTELPEEDRVADSQSATPDLWELLSSGMEQLKADLELASKYAASIDANGLEVVDNDGPLAIAS